MSGSAIDSTMRRELAAFRAAREANDQRARAALIRAYGAQYRQIQKELDALLRRIEAGGGGRRSLLIERQRLTDLQRTCTQRLIQFGGTATTLIQAEQATAVVLSQYQAGALIRSALREAPTRVVSRYGRPNDAAIEAVTAQVHTSPLRELFEARAFDAAKQVADVLTTGVGMGWNPAQIRREFRKTLGTNLQNGLTVARTETMRAHRAGADAMYRDNSDVVLGKIRVVGPGCCAACLALADEELAVGDQLEVHPNCACVEAPKTITYAELGFPGIPEPGPVAAPSLDDMSVDEMARRFGNRSLAVALDRGEITLADTVIRTSNARWGGSIRQGSLKQARENAAARGVRPPAAAPRDPYKPDYSADELIRNYTIMHGRPPSAAQIAKLRRKSG